jgi:hypothetical protein
MELGPRQRREIGARQRRGKIRSSAEAPEARQKVARGEREARCPWDPTNKKTKARRADRNGGDVAILVYLLHGVRNYFRFARTLIE